MKMQYDAGNLSGYLEYKKFLEFLEGEKTGKGEKVSSDEEESKVETNIHVEPDGARVLVMTRKMGGMQTTTSIELSKPTKSPYEQSGQEGEEEEAKGWVVPDISNVSEQLFGE